MSASESQLRYALFDAIHKLEEASGYVAAGATAVDARFAAELRAAAQKGRDALGALGVQR